MKTILSTIVLLICLTRTCAAGQFAVAVDKEIFSSGGSVGFVLVAISQYSTVHPVFPSQIACFLEAAGHEIRVIANQLESNQKNIRPNSMNSQKYSLVLPEEMYGNIVITFAEVDVPRVVIDVEPFVAVEEYRKSSGENTLKTGGEYSAFDSMSFLYQPYLKNTGAYEPTYFLVGTEPEKSKFQISFKYKIFDSSSSFAQYYPWTEGFHFAYTQTSFWDLGASSAPFADTSYKPEIFWQSQNFLNSGIGLLKGVYFQGGVQHESNGKADVGSRSTNYIYGKPIFIFYDEDSHYGMMVSSKIWGWLGNDNDTNPDLKDYRGYFELEAKVGHGSGIVGGALLRWADNGPSIQFDLSYPMNHIFKNFLDIYFYIQYVDMLAESLIDYEGRTRALRLGLAIIR